MKTIFTFLFIAASQVVFAQSATFKSLRYDEDYSSLKTDTSGNWYNSLKFQPLSPSKDTYISYGGEVRYQYFWYQNEDWGAAPADKDGFILTRLLGSLDFHSGKYFRAFIQLQSSLDDGSVVPPSPVDQDVLDLHQAFFDINLFPQTDQRITFRVGRQEMAYGSSRLISVREGPNVRESFDAAKFMFQEKNFKLDAFYGYDVPPRPGIFDDTFSNQTGLWGVYATFNKVPLLNNIDLYYLGVHREQEIVDEGQGDEIRHSVGSRIWYNSKDWNYDLEGLYQFGKFKTENISAWTVSLNTAYTFTDLVLKPQFGFKTELISGDRNYNDGELNTFDPLFPKGAYFGLVSIIGPANLTDFHPYASISPSRRLIFTADYDIFHRMSKDDGIYGPDAILIYSGKNASSSQIGNQLQSELEYNVNKFLYLRADFTWFKAGEYLKEVGPGKDILVASTTIQFKF